MGSPFLATRLSYRILAIHGGMTTRWADANDRRCCREVEEFAKPHGVANRGRVRRDGTLGSRTAGRRKRRGIGDSRHVSGLFPGSGTSFESPANARFLSLSSLGIAID